MFPWRAVIPFLLVRMSEAIAMMSLTPYAPMFVEFLGVSKSRVGFWAGFLVAIFLLSQALTAYHWSAASDRFGRKPILLSGLFFGTLSQIIWAFSSSIPSASIARVINGGFNGNTAVFRTAMSELITHKSHKHLAYSMNPAAFFIGNSIGSAMGGVLFNPLGRKPNEPSNGKLFSTFPALLPSLVVIAVSTFSLVLGWLFVPETHAELRTRRDIGMETGDQLVYQAKRAGYTLIKPFDRKDVLEAPVPPEPRHSPEGVLKPKPPVALLDALTPQNMLNVVVHTFMAFHTLAMAELLPIFIHQEYQSAEDANKRGFLRYGGGLGWSPKATSGFMGSAALFTLVFQVFVYPQIGKRVDGLSVYRFVMFAYPVIYVLFPLVVYLKTEVARHTFMLVLWFIMSALGTAAFPTSQMMMEASADPGALATINAIISITACLGRAAGPFMTGSLFSWGADHTFTPVSFLFVTGIALANALCTLGLKNNKKPAPVKAPARQNNADAERASTEGTHTTINANIAVFIGRPDDHTFTSATGIGLANSDVERASTDETTPLLGRK